MLQRISSHMMVKSQPQSISSPCYLRGWKQTDGRWRDEVRPDRPSVTLLPFMRGQVMVRTDWPVVAPGPSGWTRRKWCEKISRAPVGGLTVDVKWWRLTTGVLYPLNYPPLNLCTFHPLTCRDECLFLSE